MSHQSELAREAEIEAIDRMCRFAEFTGARIMIFHVSTREGAEIVRQAQVRVPAFPFRPKPVRITCS